MKENYFDAWVCFRFLFLKGSIPCLMPISSLLLSGSDFLRAQPTWEASL